MRVVAPAHPGTFPHNRRAAAAILSLFVHLGCGGAVPDASRSNLLLVTVDTLHADRLGAYGYEAIETPAIDRLAGEGVRFVRTVTPVPLTLPAHASLMTGMTPPGHGLRDNGAGVLRDNTETLAEASGPLATGPDILERRGDPQSSRSHRVAAERALERSPGSPGPPR